MSRGRPSGSTNKKFGVKVKDLCAVFSPEFVMPVSKGLAKIIQTSNNSINIIEMDNNNPINPQEQTPQTPAIEFRVIEPQ